MKIPPVVLVLVCVSFIGILANTVSLSLFSTEIRLLTSALLTFVAAAVCVAGVVQFKLHQTTVNPMNPESASSLVQSGIYKFTRNPMYLGFAIFLFACAWYVSSIGGFLVVPLFVFYMNVFQIKPEERALGKLFGEEYSDYKNRVRRWA